MSSPNPYHATGLVHFIPPKNISVDKFKFIAPVFFGSLILLPPPVGKQKKGAQNQNACTIKSNNWAHRFCSLQFSVFIFNGNMK